MIVLHFRVRSERKTSEKCQERGEQKLSMLHFVNISQTCSEIVAVQYWKKQNFWRRWW